MNTSTLSLYNNATESTLSPGYPIRFWSYLFSNIFSLLTGFFDLYYLLSDASLRQALHNYVIIILLCLGIFYELTDIIWILYNDHNRRPLIQATVFYEIWTYINYTFYSIALELFAWATIERHILIFHQQWIATKRRCFFLHYFPPIAIIIYYLIYLAYVHFDPFCVSDFQDFLNGGIHIPCAFYRTVLGLWDIDFHQVFPTLVIVGCSIGLIIRTIIQRQKLTHEIQWKKYRKMIVQLLSISVLYITCNGPWVLVIFAFQFGLSPAVTAVALTYTGFLYYYVIFLFPMVCCLSLPELRKKFREKVLFCLKKKPKKQNVALSTTKVTMASNTK
ncbi:unnamed protein product [Adineta ricciae]|uniref:G-protein coupled receptors family 1 profile domain-containing protein n=1 Tax=Adineta ricciae TaxID=249248 RepID=A0A815QGR0_ADIRI|nr:unnamed protein product [Adineta ricciae]CAF1463016.1 unnamed protein product [Adineta ricciae]